MIYYLIGMMGSGKTTTGNHVAQMIDYDFIDTDQLIELHTGKRVHEIIETAGIANFRELESTLFLRLNLPPETIVSCGGGIVLRKENVEHMKNNGTIIYLSAEIPTLVKRLKETPIGDRPLLSANLAADLAKIYTERKALYEQAADYTINVDGLSVLEVTYKIIDIIKG